MRYWYAIGVAAVFTVGFCLGMILMDHLDRDARDAAYTALTRQRDIDAQACEAQPFGKIYRQP